MEISGGMNREYLKMMEDIYHVSETAGLKSFIWGGFVADPAGRIYAGTW